MGKQEGLRPDRYAVVARRSNAGGQMLVCCGLSLRPSQPPRMVSRRTEGRCTSQTHVIENNRVEGVQSSIICADCGETHTEPGAAMRHGSR